MSYKEQELSTLHEHQGSSKVFGGLRVSHLFSVYFFFIVFVLCLVPNVACFSELSILDFHFGFLWRLFTHIRKYTSLIWWVWKTNVCMDKCSDVCNEKDMLSAAPTITIMFMKAFVLSECMGFYGIVMSIAGLKQFSICYCHLCWCILFQDSFCIGNETSPWLYRFRSYAYNY